VQILSPQGYLDFLLLMKHCRFIITDSGGIQEEATSPSISKRTLVARHSTERPEAIVAGHAELLELKANSISDQMKKEWNRDFRAANVSPYGDGTTSRKIIGILAKEPRQAFLTDPTITTKQSRGFSLTD
jgi:UDP-N-acetylglucosamine 2-epimerase (non-hydrolysing)